MLRSHTRLDAKLWSRPGVASLEDRVPEVVIRVFSAGSNTLEAIQSHFEELQNGTHRTLEIDSFSTAVIGRRAARALIEDWDLDLDDLYYHQPYLGSRRRNTPKLVHKILFSMPAGTPPERLLAAVRSFAQEQFGDRHRYALALHTDEPHAHVHMVLKATAEGRLYHLNIRKPMLCEWRQEFARHLNVLGIPAKATRRAERRNRVSVPGIYRLTTHRPDPAARNIEGRVRQIVRTR